MNSNKQLNSAIKIKIKNFLPRFARKTFFMLAHGNFRTAGRADRKDSRLCSRSGLICNQVPFILWRVCSSECNSLVHVLCATEEVVAEYSARQKKFLRNERLRSGLRSACHFPLRASRAERRASRDVAGSREHWSSSKSNIELAIRNSWSKSKVKMYVWNRNYFSCVKIKIKMLISN